MRARSKFWWPVIFLAVLAAALIGSRWFKLESLVATPAAVNLANPSAPIRAFSVTRDIPINTAQEIELWSNAAAPSYQIVSAPGHGGLSAVSGGRVTYTPATGYVGPDVFSFTVTDSRGTSAAATVWLTVVPNPRLNRTGSEMNTMIPTLTSDHWDDPEPLRRDDDPVSKADYLDYIVDTYERRQPGGNPDDFYQYDPLIYNSFFYRALGDSSYLQQALTALGKLGAYYTTGPGASNPSIYFRRSDSAPTLEALSWILPNLASTTDEATATSARGHVMTLFDKLERFNPPTTPWQFGAGNQSMGPAAALKVVESLYPDYPDAAASSERQTIANQIWSDWTTEMDGFENATDYNGLFAAGVLHWLAGATPAERSALFSRSDFADYARRYLLQVSPLGVIPGYGDTFGFGGRPGHWVHAFESWAPGLKSADSTLAANLRWAAGQALGWIKRQEAPMDFWGNLSDFTLRDVMFGYFKVDDGIAPRAPSEGSVLTYRHDVEFKSGAVRDATGYPAVVKSNTIPDKLVIRTGWDEDDFYALFELAPPLGHGHNDTGSLNALIEGGSLLLGDTPYAIKDHRFHNAFQLIPSGQESVSNQETTLRSMRTTNPSVRDGRLGTIANFSISSYLGRSVELSRSIFMLKSPRGQSPYLWVRDRIVGSEEDSFSGMIGPAWQTQTIYGARGNTWVNTTFQTIPVGYVDVLEYIAQWSNANRDLLMIFPGASSLSIENVSRDTTRLNSTVDQQNTSRLKVGALKSTVVSTTPQSFSTLLVPHAPTPDATELAEQFRSVIAESNVTVVSRTSGNVKEYLGVNDLGATISFDGITTNATRLMLVRDGSTLSYQVEGVRSLVVDGKTVLAENGTVNREGSFSLGSTGSTKSTTTSSTTVRPPEVAGAVTPEPATPVVAPESSLPKLVGPFAYGMKSEQVRVLQQMLARDPSIVPPAPVSGVYDMYTAKAVSIFQKRLGLVTYGTPDTTGFGLAGPATRAKLNELYGGATVTPTATIDAERRALILSLQTKLLELLIKLRDALLLSA